MWALLARRVLAELAGRALRFLGLCLLGLLMAVVSSGCLSGAGLLALRNQPAASGGFVVVPDGTLLPSTGPLQPAPSAGAVGAMGSTTVALLQASATQAPCVVSWPLLAGVATIEDPTYGRTRAVGPNTGLPFPDDHALGPAQFLPTTGARYGLTFNPQRPTSGEGTIFDPAYAYPALARYLCALGVDHDPVGALWRYSGCVPGPGCNRADRYPYNVLAFAAQFGVIQAPTVSPLADTLLAQARTWLGVRYVFGGTTRAGIDCSAFVQVVFATVGVQLPRVSQAQYDATIGRGLGMPTPTPGDLAFFAHTYVDPLQTVTHVGIVTQVRPDGSVWMIDAPGARAAGDPPDAPFGQVREEPIAGFWAAHLAGFAHVLPAPPAANAA